ncbi:MAG: exodeoxyribonuclease III [Steroidobacteraceae bacterium]
MIKIATWNVNSLRVRLPHLTEWLAANPVDIVALQETKLPDADFPTAEIAALGYQSVASGQKTYNGVAVLARQPMVDVLTDIPGFDDPQRRVLATTVGDIRVINLYVPNGQAVGSEKFEYKLRWLAALREWLVAEMARYPSLTVLGDFNIAPADADVHDPAAWVGQNLVSEPERAALQALLAIGLVDVFRQFEQPPALFSWWDYRQAAFRRNHGLRIDLILASEALAARCRACVIDVEPRRAERPSDHTPVIAHFD